MSREDSKSGPKGGLERRAFLKGVGVAGAGAAAAAVAGGAAEAAETNEEQAKQRYAETDHVKRFYALNRL
jgi:ribosomal protein L12E/L44/L45/RPP1/RPP2